MARVHRHHHQCLQSAQPMGAVALKTTLPHCLKEGQPQHPWLSEPPCGVGCSCSPPAVFKHPRCRQPFVRLPYLSVQVVLSAQRCPVFLETTRTMQRAVFQCLRHHQLWWLWRMGQYHFRDSVQQTSVDCSATNRQCCKCLELFFHRPTRPAKSACIDLDCA